MIGVVERVLTNVERSLLGDTWAIQRMSFSGRARIFRDFGEWPGIHGEGATRMFMQSDIEREKASGKLYCAQRKLERAREAGFEIELG